MPHAYLMASSLFEPIFSCNAKHSNERIDRLEYSGADLRPDLRRIF